MATYSRVLLSGSTNGRGISVVGTVTGTANTIHTAVAGTTSFDEVYLWVTNTSATAATLTLEWGAAASSPDHLTDAISIPANSPPIPIATGQALNNGLVVKAFSGTTAVLAIFGYVNRIS